MQLPAGYQSVCEYFKDVMQFLRDYQWVYRYPMTGLLVHNVLKCIPVEWQTVLENMSTSELKMLSSGSAQVCWPSSLVQFLEKCKQLQVEGKANIRGHKLSQKLCRGLSLKKQHEVSQMTVLVHQECQNLDIHKIVDVGSGLGYLDLVLHLDLGYRVLGVESNAAYVEAASQKASSLCPNCNEISFCVCEVSSTADSDILAVLEHWLNNAVFECASGETYGHEPKVDNVNSDGVCIIGLHTCGDLSTTAAKLFLQVPHIQLMVLVPCCYHKMTMSEGVHKEEEVMCNNFTSFPLSQALTDVLEEEFIGFEEYLGRPFLRLASQESSCHFQHWSKEQHQQHSENLMARAVLDLAAHRLGLVLRKKNRRCVRKSQRNSFDTFLDDVIKRYDFVLSDNSVIDINNCEEIVREVRTLWSQQQKLCNLAEALTGLQTAMQALVESVILVDRMTYMQEQQSQHLSLDVVKFMNDDISPRCRALIARKLR